MKLKPLMKFLALALMLLLCATAAADGAAPVSCYWQLDEVRVETAASDRAEQALAQTDAQPLSGLSAGEMVRMMRGTRSLSLGLTRGSNGARAGRIHLHKRARAHSRRGGCPAEPHRRHRGAGEFLLPLCHR